MVLAPPQWKGVRWPAHVAPHRVVTEDRWWDLALALLARGDDERRCVGQITWVSHGTSRASPKAAPGGTSKAFAPNTAGREHNAQNRTKLE